MIRQDDRLFVVEPLEQRQDDSGAEESRAEKIGGIEPPLQPPGQEEQSYADQAPEKVGEFHDRQRKKIA